MLVKLLLESTPGELIGVKASYAMKKMDKLLVPENEIWKRINGFQERLRSSDADGAFLVERADIYYFSGSEGIDYMFVPAEGRPSLCLLATRTERDHLAAQRYYDVYYVNEKGEIKRILRNTHREGTLRVGLEFDVISLRELEFCRDLFEATEFFDVSPLILAIRAIKSPWELERMREAAGVTSVVFEAINSIIKVDITEMELSAEAEAIAQMEGETYIDIRVRDYKTEGYPWHVLSGPNGGMVGLLDSPASGLGTSAAFPCGASHRRIQANEPVMVDFAFEVNGYHMDETRMFCIDTMPRDAMEASEAVIEIHNFVLEHVRPGTSVGDLFDYSVAKAHELGYVDTYLGPQGYQVSFVGHGIGAELIEWPLIAKGRDDMLEPGMTFALEPKIVVKDKFIAGVESVVAVTETGHELISKVPVKVFVC